MYRMGKLVLVSCFTMLIACTGGDDGGGGGGGGNPTPVPTPSPPGSSGTEVIGEAGLCSPGEAATLTPDSTGRIFFQLPPVGFTASSDCDNADDRNTKNDEYAFVFFNSSGAQHSFDIASLDEGELQAKTSGGSSGLVSGGYMTAAKTIASKNNFSAKKLEAHEKFFAMSPYERQQLLLGIHPEMGDNDESGGYLNLKNGNAVGDEFEYRFPADPEISACNNESAIVRVIGERARIATDRDLAYSETSTGDPLCAPSGVLCIDALQRLSDIIDNNLWPLITNLTGGEPSDVDDDGLVTIVITPRMNSVNPVPETIPFVPEHGFTMETDFLPFDETTNDCSSEGEYIYIHAPDPDGVFEPEQPISLSEYANATLPGAVMFQLEKLISYNQHVFINEGLPEEDWLSNSIGQFFVDMAGFYVESAFLEKLALYLDVPSPIGLISDDPWHEEINLGLQFLFGSFIFHSQLDDTVENDANNLDQDFAFIPDLYGDLTGTENLVNALEFEFNPAEDDEFTAMFKYAALAMTVAGRPSLIISSSDFPYYKDQNSTHFGSGVAAGTGSSRAGANGGSLDVDASPNPVFPNLNGFNFGRLFENPDKFTYTPGNNFDGWVEPLGYTFVRAGGLIEATSKFKFNFTSSNGQGFVVRLDDIDTSEPIVHAESVNGTLDTTRETIGSTTVDYTAAVANASTTAGDARSQTLTIVGEIESPDLIPVYDINTFEVTFESVPDYDFYNITIPSGVGATDADRFAIWLEVQPDDAGGASSYNPLIAMVSGDDVPNPDELEEMGVPEMRYVIDVTASDEETYITEDVFDDPNDNSATENGDNCSLTSNSSPSSYSGLGGFNWATSISSVFFSNYILVTDVTSPAFDATTDPPTYYEPRPNQELTINCQGTTDGDPKDNANDIISSEEVKTPASLQEQILTYMSRERDYDFTGSGGDAYTSTSALGNSITTYSGGNPNEDALVVDPDSVSEANGNIQKGVRKDWGNNTGGYSIAQRSGAIIQTEFDPMERLVFYDIPEAVGAGYTNLPNYSAPINFNPPTGTGLTFNVNADSTYTILVGGQGGSIGRYELKLRKIDPTTVARAIPVIIFD